MDTYSRDIEWYIEAQEIIAGPLQFVPAPVSFIEIWSYPDGDSQILEGLLQPTEIQTWANREAPRLVKDGQQMDPINGIRLCIESRRFKPGRYNAWSFHKKDLLALLSDFRLPSAFLHAGIQDLGRYSMFTRQELAGKGSDKDFGYIITPCTDLYTEMELSFSWSNATRTTCGMLRVCDQAFLDHYIRLLKSFRHLVGQPLVLGLVVLETVLAVVPGWIRSIQDDIAAVQRRTGHLGGIAITGLSPPGPLDYNQVSIEVSKIGQTISWNRALYKSYLYLCEFIEQSATRSRLVEECNGPGSSTASATNWEIFSEFLSANKSQIMHDLSGLDYYKDLCVIQNQNVYNLIAQRDVQQNIELARDSKSIAVASKRDSSAMKSIALLTMVILPGTFISTLFAIPLFNWDAASWRDVPKSRFWFYWALTIPLTILTVGAWLAWQKVYERTGRSLEKAAREEIPNSKIPHDRRAGSSSSSSEQDEVSQDTASDGPRMRRSSQETETNHGQSPV